MPFLQLQPQSLSATAHTSPPLRSLFPWLQPQSRPATAQTSLPLRSLFPCHFCSSSPSHSQRPLTPRSPSVALDPCHFCSSSPSHAQRPLTPRSSVASSHAISAAPAPVTLSDRSNLAPRGRLLNENPSISEMLLGKKRLDKENCKCSMHLKVQPSINRLLQEVRPLFFRTSWHALTGGSQHTN